jgi:hypothetical protein
VGISDISTAAERLVRLPWRHDEAEALAINVLGQDIPLTDAAESALESATKSVYLGR